MFLTTIAVLLLGAESSPEVPEAKRLFEAGRAHRRAGRHELACAAFSESLERQRTLGTLLNLASCSEALARFADAWRFADEASVLARASHDPREGVASELRRRAESHVAFVEVHVTRLPRAGELSAAGQVTPLAEPVTHLVVPVGPLHVLMRAPGRLPLKVEATLGAKEVLRLTPWKDPLPSVEAASAHPWFSRTSGAISFTTRRLERAFPYFGIPDNGCAGGSTYLVGVLAEASDELPAGTEVVVRAKSSLGTKPGLTTKLTRLRRAGLSPGRTPVFCEAGSPRTDG